MRHLDFFPTPLTKLPYYSDKLGVELISKRDDLFLEAGGGSKARMLQYILADVNPHTCDVLVTAGGPCSNFNRACALMCAKLGVPMHLVEYSDNIKEFDTSLNYYLCNLTGMRKTRCEKTNVPEVIKEVMASYDGCKAKFVYGGGKSVEGIYAYYDAVRELKQQIDEIDEIFVTCGTGTTLTGICAGVQEFFPATVVYGISVARSWENEKKVLDEDMKMINDYLGSKYDFSNLCFSDEYLCGGYDRTTPNLLKCVQECISHEGMIVDPCYSGKAFYGMVETILKNKSSYKGKKVLFWNTGGIINLLSMREEYNC